MLLTAIALHVLAIFGYAAVKGQNLLLPLITGTKILPESVPAPRIESPARAAFLGCAWVDPTIPHAGQWPLFQGSRPSTALWATETPARSRAPRTR